MFGLGVYNGQTANQSELNDNKHFDRQICLSARIPKWSDSGGRRQRVHRQVRFFQNGYRAQSGRGGANAGWSHQHS